MKNLFFWKEWYRSYQIPYIFLLGVLVISMVGYFYFYYTGADWTFQWKIDRQMRSIKHTIDEVNIGAFKIPIEGEMLLIDEKFKTTEHQIHHWFYGVYGIFLALALVVLLSVFTMLNQLGFGVGMTVFAFFLSYLQLDYLNVWAYRNGVLMVSLVLYLSLGFYFNTFGKAVALYKRIVAFGILTAGWLTWIIAYSQVAYPVLYLVNYGIAIPVILTLLFITIVAHDIVYGFFALIVRYNAQAGNSNLIHFTVITFAYLANVFLLYLHQRGYWKVEMYYLDAYILLAISAILGLTGFQKRNILVQRLLPAVPEGAYFYVAMAILSFSTIAFFFATANDAMTDVFNDTIIAALIGFGVMFYLFVLANFSSLVQSGTSPEKIVYHSVMFPYNIMRYFGFVLILAFYIADKQIQYYQTVSGIYNGIGDTYFAHKDYRLAKLNYEQAFANDYLNHRSNYALATIAALEKEEKNKFYHLKTAIRRQPTPQSFIRLSNDFWEREQELDALINLKEGIKIFPRNIKLHNNLAFLYAFQKIPDSTLYHFSLAEKYAFSPAPQNNLWAYLAENLKEGLDLDSLPDVKDEQYNIVGRINKLALYNRYKTPITFRSFLPIRKVDEREFAWMYNYALNKMGTSDSLAIQQILNFEKIDKKARFKYRTQFIEACYEYYKGDVEKGVQLLASIPNITDESYYNVILGLWLLEQECYGNALYYLQRAIDLGNQQAVFYKVVALSEAGDLPKAIQTWQELKTQPQQTKENIAWANKILKVLKDSTQLEDDTDKYNLIHYKKQLIPTKILQEIYFGIQDPNIKTKTAADLILFYIQKNEISQAETLYKSLQTSPKVGAFVQSEINYAYMRLLLATKEYAKLLAEMENLTLAKIHRNKKALIRALVYEAQKDNKNAESNYLSATRSAPFSEEVIMESARFFNEKKKDIEKAYKILVEGVRANAFSVKMYKQYCLQCLEMGLDDYADTALEQIKQNTKAEDFAKFQQIFEAKKEEIKRKRE